MTRYPTAMSRPVMPRPSPRLPPVTITSRMLTRQFSGSIDREGGNDVDCRRDFMPGKHVVTELQDVALKFFHSLGLSIEWFPKDNIRNHKGPCDAVSTCPDE